MDFDKRLRQMLAQPRAQAGAGHGVPLVADAAGVEPQRARRVGFGAQRRDFRRDETRFAVVGEESAVGEEALLRLQLAVAHRPLHRRHRVERLVRDRQLRPPISKSRLPLFSNADRLACSRKISAAELKSNAAPKPSRFATSLTIHQSGLASPAGGRKPRWREMRRSELVTGAGLLAPGLRRQQHMRAGIDGVVGTRHSPRPRTIRALAIAARTTSASGSDTTGLVPITHNALISPRPIASNSCTAFNPSWVAMRGAFQNRRTRSMSGGVKSICAASWLERPPTSRPPIALGCPVSENGDAPILPIRPVARWQLRIALTLSVPCADWLTPCEYSVTTRGVAANIWKNFVDVAFGEARRERGRGGAAGDAARPRQCFVETRGMAFDVIAVERTAVGEMHQQSAEQRGVGARLQSEEQVRISSGIGAARVDHHHAGAALLLVRHHALEQHRVAPCRVRAGQHQQIRLSRSS